MCVVCFAIVNKNGGNGNVEFVLLNGRDEVEGRPTTELQEDAQLVAAIDLEKGGTWMGLNKNDKRLVVLTNVRGEKILRGPKSRGLLVMKVLRGEQDIDLSDYHAWNLLQVDLSSIQCSFSSSHFEQVSLSEEGVHAFSNADLNDFSWPKVKYLKHQLDQIISQFTLRPDEESNILESALLRELGKLLMARPNFPDHECPEFPSYLGPERERELQRNVRVCLDGYLTSAQTIVIKTVSNIHYLYRSVGPDIHADPGPWVLKTIAVESPG